MTSSITTNHPTGFIYTNRNDCIAGGALCAQDLAIEEAAIETSLFPKPLFLKLIQFITKGGSEKTILKLVLEYLHSNFRLSVNSLVHANYPISDPTEEFYRFFEGRVSREAAARFTLHFSRQPYFFQDDVLEMHYSYPEGYKIFRKPFIFDNKECLHLPELGEEENDTRYEIQKRLLASESYGTLVFSPCRSALVMSIVAKNFPPLSWKSKAAELFSRRPIGKSIVENQVHAFDTFWKFKAIKTSTGAIELRTLLAIHGRIHHHEQTLTLANKSAYRSGSELEYETYISAFSGESSSVFSALSPKKIDPNTPLTTLPPDPSSRDSVLSRVEGDEFYIDIFNSGWHHLPDLYSQMLNELGMNDLDLKHTEPENRLPSLVQAINNPDSQTSRLAHTCTPRPKEPNDLLSFICHQELRFLLTTHLCSDVAPLVLGYFNPFLSYFNSRLAQTFHLFLGGRVSWETAQTFTQNLSYRASDSRSHGPITGEPYSIFSPHPFHLQHLLLAHASTGHIEFSPDGQQMRVTLLFKNIYPELKPSKARAIDLYETFTIAKSSNTTIKLAQHVSRFFARHLHQKAKCPSATEVNPATRRPEEPLLAVVRNHSIELSRLTGPDDDLFANEELDDTLLESGEMDIVHTASGAQRAVILSQDKGDEYYRTMPYPTSLLGRTPRHRLFYANRDIDTLLAELNNPESFLNKTVDCLIRL